MKRFDVKDALSLVLVLATAVFSSSLVARLPERVAIHFDAYGQPNGWAPPAIAAFGMPIFAFVVWLFVRVSPYLMSGKKREAALAAPLSATGLLVTLFVCALHVVLLENALGAGIDMMTALGCLMGCLCIALGLIMLGTRRNPLIGIRTRWTLESDENWARTHKLAALTFTIAGLAAIASPLAGPPASFVILLAGVMFAAIVPTLYSYVLAKRGV